MNILAINSSSTSGSIAIYKGDKITFLCYLDITVTHSERLMYQIDSGLMESKLDIKDLDTICFANGPGSFTGLRIGLATVKGLAMPNKIPVIPFNTLQLYAYNLYGVNLPILVMIDAKMNETYAALYSADMKEIIPPHNTKPEVILNKINQKVYITGNGITKFKQQIENAKIDYLVPLMHQNNDLASVMISIFLKENKIPEFDFEFLSELEPYYLRKSQAELAYENKIKGKKNV